MGYLVTFGNFLSNVGKLKYRLSFCLFFLSIDFKQSFLYLSSNVLNHALHGSDIKKKQQKKNTNQIKRRGNEKERKKKKKKKK